MAKRSLLSRCPSYMYGEKCSLNEHAQNVVGVLDPKLLSWLWSLNARFDIPA